MENKEFQELVEKYVESRDSNNEDTILKNQITAEVFRKIDISIKSIFHPYTLILAEKRFNISFSDFKSEGMIIFLRCLRLYKIKNNNNFYGYFYFSLKRRLNQIIILANRKIPLARTSISNINEYNMVINYNLRPKITRVPINEELEVLEDKKNYDEDSDDVFFTDLNNFPRLLNVIKDDLCKNIELEDMRNFILKECSEKGFVEMLLKLKSKSLKTFVSESNLNYRIVTKNIKKIAKEMQKKLEGELCCL